VVVSSDAYHRQGDDVVVMAVTSQLSKPSRAPGDILITEWEKAGLLKPSLIKPVIATLERGLILRKLGELRDRDREALRAGIQDVFG
jgi:mRNA interferase MazF